MIYLNNIPIKPTIFPDNTSQVWKLKSFQPLNLIKWKFQQESEFMHLAQLKALLDHNNVSSVLEITYLPYGRQDKKVSNETTFALRVFAHLLNQLDFKIIHIQDPHSNVAMDFIKNSVAIYPTDHIRDIFRLMKSDVICYPDIVAVERYSGRVQLPYYHQNKTRDQSTGEIINTEIIGNFVDRNVLIVDDICDGGSTFIKLANDLVKAKGAKEVNLFVTHGIFSKGLKILKNNNINRIFTIDGEVGEYQNSLTYRRIYED